MMDQLGVGCLDIQTIEMSDQGQLFTIWPTLNKQRYLFIHIEDATSCNT